MFVYQFSFAFSSIVGRDRFQVYSLETDYGKVGRV